MERLDELQAEIDSLKSLLRGKVTSSETNKLQQVNNKNLLEKKTSFNFDSAPKAIAYPTGCEDLIFNVSNTATYIPQGISGIYLLRGTGVNIDKIEVVHCDFTNVNTPGIGFYHHLSFSRIKF